MLEGSKKITISLTSVLWVVTLFAFGCIAWNAKETYELAKDNAAVKQQQSDIVDDVSSIKDNVNDLSEKFVDFRVKQETTNELVKQLATQQQINVKAVEARVIKKIEQEDSIATTTTNNTAMVSSTTPSL